MTADGECHHPVQSDRSEEERSNAKRAEQRAECAVEPRAQGYDLLHRAHVVHRDVGVDGRDDLANAARERERVSIARRDRDAHRARRRLRGREIEARTVLLVVYAMDLPGGTCSRRMVDRIAVTGPKPVVRSSSWSYST